MAGRRCEAAVRRRHKAAVGEWLLDGHRCADWVFREESLIHRELGEAVQNAESILSRLPSSDEPCWLVAGCELEDPRRASPSLACPPARPRPQAWKPSIMASLASAHTPKDTSQRARRDQSGTSRRRESKQPVDVGTKRAAAGRLRTDRGAAAVESTPHRFYGLHTPLMWVNHSSVHATMNRETHKSRRCSPRRASLLPARTAASSSRTPRPASTSVQSTHFVAACSWRAVAAVEVGPDSVTSAGR